MTLNRIFSSGLKYLLVILIAVTIVCCFYILFEFNQPLGKFQFAEYKLNEQEIVDTIFSQNRIERVQLDSAKQLNKFKNRHHARGIKFHYKPSKKQTKDENKILSVYTSISKALDTNIKRRDSLAYVHINAKLFSRDNFVSTVVDSFGSAIYVPAYIVDHRLPTKRIDGYFRLTSQKLNQVPIFFINHPDFGAWFMMLLIVIACATFGICFQVYYIFFTVPPYALDQHFTNSGRNNEIENCYSKSSLAVVFAAGICFFFFKDFIFSSSNDWLPLSWCKNNSVGVFNSINFLGYLSGCLSVAGMIICSMHACRIRALTTNSNIELKKLQESYQYLIQNIKTFLLLGFLLVILSAICIATLVRAVNQLPILKLFSKTQANDLISFNVVYLYAFLHSIVLLAIYFISKRIVNSVPDKFRILVVH